MRRRTKVKVCGITRPQDAASAARAGAWAVGLVFCARSPRCVSIAQAELILRALPPGVLKVGVFLDAHVTAVRKIRGRLSLDLVQLHGRGASETALALGPENLILAAPLREAGDVARAWGAPAEYVLVDRDRTAGAPRGAVDWALAGRLARRRPRTLLAGGLTPDNVAEAVRKVRPWGVDVSSGVESRAGIKDPALVRAFLAAVRRADAG